MHPAHAGLQQITQQRPLLHDSRSASEGEAPAERCQRVVRDDVAGAEHLKRFHLGAARPEILIPISREIVVACSP